MPFKIICYFMKKYSKNVLTKAKVFGIMITT